MRRVVGIDIARGLALLGMFVAHAAPPVRGDGVAAFLVGVPDERSRLLFALTAGLGLGLLTAGSRQRRVGQGSDPPGGESRAMLRRQIAVRAVCLLALGLVLQDTGVLVLVILDEYGIAFLIMLPFVFLSARWLLAAGTVLLAVAPAAVAVLDARVGLGELGAYAQLGDWFVTGSYPVLTWVAVLMLGVGMVRLGLSGPAVVLAGIVGLVAMVAGLGLSIALGGDGIEAEPIAGRVGLTSAAVGTSAFAIGNVGFCLALTALLVALASGPIGRVLAPVAAAGAMPLSVYTAHLLVLLAVTRETPAGSRTDDGWPVVIGLVVGALTLPWLWRRVIGRGPIERLIARLSGRVPDRGHHSRRARSRQRRRPPHDAMRRSPS